MHVRGCETNLKSRLKRRFEADGAGQKSGQINSEHTMSVMYLQLTKSLMVSVLLHTRLLDEENEDNEPVVISESGNWANIPLAISQLFNFTTNSWSSLYARFVALIFEKELELYDLLEMDAEGHSNPKSRFDDATQDILLG